MKLTNDAIDYFIIKNNKQFKRVEIYKKSRVAISFECTVESCKKIWKARALDILNDGGCPVCAVNKTKFTNEHIDNFISKNNRQFKRIEDYVNSRTPILFECNICKNIWKANTGPILNKSYGCPKCSLGTLNNNIVDQFLIKNNKKIIRNGDYINAYTPIYFKCEIAKCKNIWKTRPDSIMRKKLVVQYAP